MTTWIVTPAEFEAYSLVRRGQSVATTDGLSKMVSEDCDYIIGLAERIKSQRASATLQAVVNRS